MPKIDEELNTFSNTLKSLQNTLSSLVPTPMNNIRADGTNPAALHDTVMELA